jgi:hypothetical protein
MTSSVSCHAQSLCNVIFRIPGQEPGKEYGHTGKLPIAKVILALLKYFLVRIFRL